MNEIVTFFGTDGSGKTTIARKLREQYKGEVVNVIGGSTYKEWLTPTVANEVFGPGNQFGEQSSSPEDMIKLYEDIGIACYGLAFLLKSRGEGVIIDSDPYLKRLIWGTLDQDNAGSLEYIDRFNTRVSDVIGASVRPDSVVAVNMRANQLQPEDILHRLSQRDANSEHDPKNITEVSRLGKKVTEIWQEVELSSQGQGSYDALNRRLKGIRVLHIDNPAVEPAGIDNQSELKAQVIKGVIETVLQ